MDTAVMEKRTAEWDAEFGKRLTSVLATDKHTGDERRIPVDHRSLLLTSADAIGTGRYRIGHGRNRTCKCRGRCSQHPREDAYTVHRWEPAPAEKWPQLDLGGRRPDGGRWVQTHSRLSGAEMFLWLAGLVGDWRAVRLLAVLAE